jgi:hypothetical protein
MEGAGAIEDGVGFPGGGVFDVEEICDGSEMMGYTVDSNCCNYY